MDLMSWLGQQILALQREFHQDIAPALRGAHGDAAGLMPMVGVALCLGAIHALTPGHGKAILFTYFLGQKARPWAGIVAAAQVAAMHIGAAVVLVVAFGGTMSMLGRPSGVAAMLQTLSAVALTAAGCWYLWRALRPSPISGRSSHHAPGVLAIGLLPCPLTMMILSIALNHGNLGVGLVLVATMGVGIMLTIGICGTSGIVLQRGIARGIEGRLNRYRATIRGLEIASALAILALGSYAFIGSI
jgi:nickel/cobalt exporter